MKVVIFLGLLAVATYVTAYRCKEDGRKCVNDMINAVQASREETEEVYCGKIRKSVDCIIAVADRCMSKRERQEAQKHIDRMIENTNNICSEQNDDKNEVDDSELPDESVTADGCKEEGENCVNDMMELFKGSQDEEKEVYCGKLKKSFDCTAALADRCISESEGKYMQKQIDRMVENTNKFCSEQNDDENALGDIELLEEDQKIFDCVNVGKILSYVGDCSDQLMQKIKSRPWEITGSLRDNTCENVLFLTQCASKKVAEDCGEETKEPVFNGFISELKKQKPDAAKSPKCAEAIQEAEEYFSN